MVYKTICSSGEVGKFSVIVTDIKQYGMIVKHWQGLQNLSQLIESLGKVKCIRGKLKRSDPGKSKNTMNNKNAI